MVPKLAPTQKGQPNWGGSILFCGHQLCAQNLHLQPQRGLHSLPIPQCLRKADQLRPVPKNRKAAPRSFPLGHALYFYVHPRQRSPNSQQHTWKRDRRTLKQDTTHRTQTDAEAGSISCLSPTPFQVASCSVFTIIRIYFILANRLLFECKSLKTKQKNARTHNKIESEPNHVLVKINGKLKSCLLGEKCLIS